MEKSPQPIFALGYARDTEFRRSALFSRRYVTIGVLVLALGALRFLAHVAGIATLAQVDIGPWGTVLQVGVLLAAGLAVDVLLLFGSVCSFSRASRGRRLILLAAKIDLTVTGVEFLVVLCTYFYGSWLGLIAQPGAAVVWLILGSTIRAAIDVAILAAYQDMRADFFFMEHQPEPPLIAPRAATPQAARFLLHGNDTATGREVQHESRAANEALARKSGIALGLDPATLTVERLPATERPMSGS